MLRRRCVGSVWTKGGFTPGPFCFVCSEPICMFPLGCLVKLANMYVPHACRSRFALWDSVLDNNNKNRMSCRLTWCSGEVKCFMDIWTDEHITQKLEAAQRDSGIYKIVGGHAKTPIHKCTRPFCPF